MQSHANESRRAFVRITAICTAFVCFVWVLSDCAAQESNGKDSIPFPVEMGDFQLSVVDDSGEPIEGAEVLVGGVRCQEDPGSWYAWPAGNGGPMPIVPTDSDGVAKFKFPTKLGSGGKYFQITTLTMTAESAAMGMKAQLWSTKAQP